MDDRPVTLLTRGLSRRGAHTPRRSMALMLPILVTLLIPIYAQTASAAAPAQTSAAPDVATRVARKLTLDIARSVAQIRGLPLRKPLKVKVYDEETLRAFLLRQIDHGGGAAHLRVLGRSLRRFGLIAPGVGLRAAYVKLLQEQVAGLYDPATKELRVMRKLVPVGVQLPNPMHLLTGSPEDQLRFVMAHEIVHALQDQRWDLGKLAKDRRGETDLETALSSLFEGDATLGGLLWAMKDKQGAVDLRALLTAGPAIQRMMTGALSLAKVGLLPGGAGLGDAPPFLQERLIVPYTAGLALCMAAAGRMAPAPGKRSKHSKRSKRNKHSKRSKHSKHSKHTKHSGRRGDVRGMAGIDALYARPPLSMEQVLHPEKMWRDKPDYPVILRLPTLTRLLGQGAKRLHRDDLGELYIRRMLRSVLPEPAADRAAAGWGGDRYTLLRVRGGDALVWLSTWDTELDAEEFERALASWLKAQPDHDAARDGFVRRGKDVLLWRGILAETARRVQRRVFKRTRRTVRRRLPR